MPLSHRRQRFVDEYLLDLDPAAAYRRAGYKPTTDRAARNAASRLMGEPDVAAAVGAAIAERSERTAVTADQVVRELAKVAFADPRKLFTPDGSVRPLAELDPDLAAAVAGNDPSGRIRMWDKMKALELLGKHLGIFVDKVEHSTPTVLHIIEEVVDAPAEGADPPAIGAVADPAP